MTHRDGVLVRRDEGITKWVQGDSTTVKLTAAQTNGALGVLETVVDPGGGAMPHAHGREEEAFYVISGDFDFINGDQTVRALPGISYSSRGETDTDSPMSAPFPRPC